MKTPIKSVLIFSIMALFTLPLYQQSPDIFNYQAVVRDISGNPIIDTEVLVEFLIHQSTPAGTVVYSETHTVTTTGYGLVSLQVGTGTTTGDISTVNWGNGPYFLEVKVDGTQLSVTQLVSVPYAAYSSKAGNVFSGAYADLTGKPDLGSFLTSESDPLFNGSAAKAITAGNITNWNAAYGWGNHTAAGYLTGESDPVFNGSPAKGITAGNITNWNTAYGWGNHAAAGYLSIETDPYFNSSVASAITATMANNWNAAYSWGNHASAGYLKTETDPVFNGSTAKTITSGNVTNWNTAYGWGNHSTQGYLKNEVDGSTTNELQVLSRSGNIIYLNPSGSSVNIGDMLDSKWLSNGGNIYYNAGNVGVGTNVPKSTLTISGASATDTAIFEVINNSGQRVFAVYNDGVRIIIDETAKGPKGGFAIGGFNGTKGTQEYFRVTSDSTRVYVNQNAKGPKGGFAIGGFSGVKGTINFVSLTPSNSLLGPSAGASLTTGSNNFFAGYQAGMSNLVGNDNIFIGTGAGKLNTSNANIFIGVNAGSSNTSAFGSVIIGDNAGINSNGNRNIIIGRRTAQGNTTGSDNIYIGNDVGNNMTTSRYNTFVGGESGQFGVSGEYNIYLGHRSGYDNDGSNNTILGALAGANSNMYSNPNTTYTANVMLGAYSGYAHTSGNNNVFLGNYSGRNNTSGSGNVFIGYQAGQSETGSNLLYINNSSSASPLVYGQFSTSLSTALLRINGNLEIKYLATGTGTTLVADANGKVLKLSSSARYKTNISDLGEDMVSFMSLRPVEFSWNELSGTPGKKDMGLIAEEVEKIDPILVNYSSDGVVEGVSYHNVSIMSIKMIQVQQNEIARLKQNAAEKDREINALNDRLNLLEQKLELLLADPTQGKSR